MTNESTARPAIDGAVYPKRQTMSASLVYVIVALLGISYAFNAMDRLVFPALLGPIRDEYSLSLAVGGLLSNAFTVTLAFFAAISGWTMRRFGRKKTMIGGLISYSFFTLLTPFATTATQLFVLRLMTGAGEAMQITAIFAMIGAFFGAKRGVFIGVINGSYGIGGFLGPMLGAAMFASTGTWHTPFYVYGVGGVIVAISILLLVPTQFSEAVDQEKAKEAAPVVAHGNVLNRNSMICVGCYALISYSFFSYAALYTSYLHAELGFDIKAAAGAFGMYGIGALMAVIFGWLGERFKQVGMIVGLILMLGVSYLLFHGVVSTTAQAGLSFVYGALVSGYLIPRILALTQRSVQPHQIDFAMSLAITMFAIPGLFAGYVYGELVDMIGWNWASVLSVTVPAGMALLVVMFLDMRRIRGE